jgi:TPR repeat protein
MENLNKLFLWTTIILSPTIITSCSWSESSGGQSTYVKSSLEEGKANFKAKHYATAYRQLLPLAVKGKTEAQYAIGYMYYYGKGIDRNEELAENWLGKAARKGDSRAIAALKDLSLHKHQPVQKQEDSNSQSEED